MTEMHIFFLDMIMWETKREKCVAHYLKVTEDTATTSIKSTAVNYLGRLLQIDDLKDSFIRIEGEYGKNVTEYYLGMEVHR